MRTGNKVLRKICLYLVVFSHKPFFLAEALLKPVLYIYFSAEALDYISPAAYSFAMHLRPFGILVKS